MTRILLLLLLSLWGWALPNPSWTVNPTATWLYQAGEASDPTLVGRLFPKDGRGSVVIVRSYPNKEHSHLQDQLTQLRFAVVTQLEGQVLSQQPWPLAGHSGFKVVYRGRANDGSFKTFVRYLALGQGQLLTVHCVASNQTPLDLLDFQAIVEGISPAAEAPPSPPLPPPAPEAAP